MHHNSLNVKQLIKQAQQRWIRDGAALGTQLLNNGSRVNTLSGGNRVVKNTVGMLQANQTGQPVAPTLAPASTVASDAGQAASMGTAALKLTSKASDVVNMAGHAALDLTGDLPKAITSAAVPAKKVSDWASKVYNHAVKPAAGLTYARMAADIGNLYSDKNLQEQQLEAGRNMGALDFTANAMDPGQLGTTAVQATGKTFEVQDAKQDARIAQQDLQQQKALQANRDRQKLKYPLSYGQNAAPQTPNWTDPYALPAAQAAFGKQASAVGNFLRGDENGKDWRYGLLGTAALNGGLMSATRLYLKGIKGAIGAPIDLAERNLMRKIKATAATDGATVLKAENSLAGALASSNKAKLGSHYNPITGEIIMAKGQRSPGVLAHELGHRMGGKGLAYANIAGKQGMGALLPLQMLSSDENNSKTMAGIGTLFGGATLASEIDASRRGYGLLRGAGAGKLRALKSFVGVPTYLAAAALPTIGFLSKKSLGGFEERPK